LTSDRDTRDTACATDGHRWWRSADGTPGPTGRDGVRHSLTYRVAMATSAANLVLLGDPQQLPHIQEASIRVTPRVRRWRICSSMRRPLPRTAASSRSVLTACTLRFVITSPSSHMTGGFAVPTDANGRSLCRVAWAAQASDAVSSVRPLLPLAPVLNSVTRVDAFG